MYKLFCFHILFLMLYYFPVFGLHTHFLKSFDKQKYFKKHLIKPNISIFNDC